MVWWVAIWRRPQAEAEARRKEPGARSQEPEEGRREILVIARAKRESWKIVRGQRLGTQRVRMPKIRMEASTKKPGARITQKSLDFVYETYTVEVLPRVAQFLPRL